MKDVSGLIFTGETIFTLGELTSLRAAVALPIAGRYRVVDFQLSRWCTAASRTSVITQKNYSSLADRHRSGREWICMASRVRDAAVPDPREHALVWTLLDALKSNSTICALPSGIHR